MFYYKKYNSETDKIQLYSYVTQPEKIDTTIFLPIEEDEYQRLQQNTLQKLYERALQIKIENDQVKQVTYTEEIVGLP